MLQALVLLSIAFLSLQLISPVSAASWTYSNVADVGDDGSFYSIAVDSNRVSHVVYCDYVNGGLRYAENSGGSWTISVVDATSNCGEYCDIAIDSENGIHISYLDRTNGDLKYAYRSSSSSSWTKTVVDDGDNLGYCTSIAIDSDDNVHISYVDMGVPILVYANNVGDYWAYDYIDIVNDQCADTSIAIDSNGKAHIAYWNSGYHPYYATNAGGSWNLVSIDDTVSTGQSCSLALDSDENVHIAYEDGAVANKDLKYATNVTGSWTTSNVATTGNVGRYCSLAIGSGDVMYITYLDDTNSDILFAENDGSGWNLTTIDSGSATGPTSMAVGPGNSLHMLYYDYSSNYLRYADQPASIFWGPEFTSHPADGQETVEYSYVPTFDEASTITAHSTNAPFLTWNVDRYTGTPDDVQSGTYWINITALSTIGGQTSVQNETFTINESWAPQFENQPMNGRETYAYSYEPELNETITFAAHSTNAPFLAWNGTAYIGTPDLTQAGTYWINITVVSVDGLLSATQNTSFTILDAWAPTVTNSPGDGQETVYYSYTVTFNETGARVTSYDTNAPFLTSNVAKGLITTYYFQGTPNSTQAGTYWLNITVESALGALTTYVNSTFIINDTWASSFESTPSDGQETLGYEYAPQFNETAQITAYGTDAAFLSWNGTAYVGTPNTTQAGTYWINITATSVNGLLTSFQNLTFSIGDSWAPLITDVPDDGRETVAYIYTPSFNETVTICASTNAAFLSWDGNKYAGTPGTDDAGRYWINITATSVSGRLTAYQNVTIIIGESWAATFTNSPGNGQETVAFNYEPTFNETVTITAYDTNAPFLAWNGTVYAGTPDVDQSGTYWINITALSANGLLSSYRNVTFIIGESWAALFTNYPMNGQETVYYQYVPTFNETVNVTGYDTNAPFLSWNGTAYVGIPNATQAGTYWINITVLSADGLLTSYQNDTFTIGVSWAAEFTNAPPNVAETQDYSYEPTFNETVTITAYDTNAAFLSWNGTAYSGAVGTSDQGVYWINITVISVNGKLSSYLNGTFTVYDSWASTFTNEPSDGQETVYYWYQPTFNETATILSYSTNAPFLGWHWGSKGLVTTGYYEGTPGLDDAGTYWINITVRSGPGLQTSYRNMTFVIGESWAPSFTNAPEDGQETVYYSYCPGLNETANVTGYDTNAPFLSWNGTAYVGTPNTTQAGTYWINITVYSPFGLLTAYQNTTFVIGGSWAAQFTNAPSNGQETVDYIYEPTFNETVTITAYDTNAAFLTWNGTAYVGTPGQNDAGTYWINITAVSVDGLLTAYLNASFVIDEAWAPTIVSEQPEGPFFATLGYEYVLEANESVIFSLSTDAPFLALSDGTVSGAMVAGTYYVNVTAYSVNGLLSSYQNYSLTVTVDSDAPTMNITGLTNGDHLNSSNVRLEWSVTDDGSGVSTVRISVDGGESFEVSAEDDLTFLFDDGEHNVTISATDNVGNDVSVTISVIVDTISPTASVSPTGSDVPLNATVVVEFSEATDIDSTSMVVSGTTGTISWNGNVMTFVPASLDYNGEYTVTVTGQDLAGNTYRTSWTFSTPAAGNVEGYLVDENGDAMANVTVSLSNGMTTVTDSDGHFSFIDVPVGVYTMTVEIEGYGSIAMNVTVGAGAVLEMGDMEMDAEGGTNMPLIVAFFLPSLVVFGIVFNILRKRKKNGQ